MLFVAKPLPKPGVEAFQIFFLPALAAWLCCQTDRLHRHFRPCFVLVGLRRGV